MSLRHHRSRREEIASDADAHLPLIEEAGRRACRCSAPEVSPSLFCPSRMQNGSAGKPFPMAQHQLMRIWPRASDGHRRAYYERR